MHDLTASERQYFEILEEMHPDPSLRRAIQAAKRDLMNAPSDRMVRGESRVQGFTVEPRDNQEPR